MNSKVILAFLRKLEANNNKVWFDTHRDEYQAARQEWLKFVEKILGHLGEKNAEFFQTPPHKCVFRINRDVRFSHNKLPYKTNFGAFFVPGGKSSGNAGYYLHLEPGRCAIAGGIYHPEKEKIDTIRQRLLKPGVRLPNIIKNKKFVQYFNDINYNHTLKIRPLGYDRNHPLIKLIRLKSFTVWKPITETQVADNNFLKTVGEHFDAMEYFINWLNHEKN